MTMKAWRVYGPNDMRLDNIESPAVAAGEALLKVLTLQPSITEVIGLGGSGYGSQQIATAVAERVPVQLFGHEFSARVLTVKGSAYGVTRGDRVTSLGKIPCTKCHECRNDQPFYCTGDHVLGMTRPGCFAELVCVPAAALARFPDNV